MKINLTPRQQAIDRGPAWIAAILSCAIVTMHYGILNCGSLYYPSWIDVMGYPISVVSWLVTGQFAVAFCLAPLYSRLLEKVPNRIGAVLGTLLTSGSIIIATFTSNIFVFMVPYTVFGGIGLGLTVIPVLGILAEYFDRYRVLALALAASGSGFGTFIFSKLDAFLIETYTWRMALIAQALLHLNVIPLRMLLYPLPPDPVPEPTVLVPEHPDLTVCDVPGLKLDQSRATDVPASNVIVSLLSVNSVRSANRFRSPGISDDMARRGRPGQDIRVVIEFVKMTCLPNRQDAFTMGQISVLANPGPRVMEQLEDRAKEYFAQPDMTRDSVLIPVMFLLGEIEPTMVTSISGSRRGLELHESSEYLGSRYEMGSNMDVGDIGHLYRQLVVGDSFASTMVAAHDRRQLKQTVYEVVQRGQKSIQHASKSLMERGLAVCPNTVTALIDQSDYFASPSDGVNFSSDDRVCVLGYYGPDDATIPEEAEPDDSTTEQSANNVTEAGPGCDAGQKLDKSKHSSQLLAPTPRSRRISTTSKGRGSIRLESMSQLSRVDKYGEACYRSRDVFASVISVSTPQQAADLLVGKLGDEVKEELIAPTTTPYRTLPRFLLADPILLSFLLSRTLCFITDSVMYAHLNNFGLVLGFGSEKSSTLLSFVGVTAMLGRLCMGFVGQFVERMDIRSTSALCLILASVCVVLLPTYPTYGVMSASCIVYGMLVSPSFAFAPGITYQIVGPHRYDEGVSYLFQFEALGFLIGGPVGGIVKEISKRYFDCFIFAAISELCSGLILVMQAFITSGLCQRYIQRCKRTRPDEEEDVEAAVEWEGEKSEDWPNMITSNSGNPVGSTGSMRENS